jgi:carbon storage regulator CsrA
MRLVFKRRRGESVRIGDSRVTVTTTSRGTVTLLIEAPAEIAVWRAELGEFDPRERVERRTAGQVPAVAAIVVPALVVPVLGGVVLGGEAAIVRGGEGTKT